MAFTSEPHRQSGKYSYENGDCFLRAESTVYHIHHYYLRQATSFFDDILRYTGEGSTTLEDNTPGSSVLTPLVLNDISETDLEALLWFFYESQYSWTYGVEPDKAVWEAILTLANKFAMRLVARAACVALDSANALEDIRKISLAKRHGLCKKWVAQELRTVISRELSLSREEAKLLGHELTAAIAHAREQALLLSNAFGEPSQAEDTVTCLHSHHVTRSSNILSSMLSLPLGSSSPQEGADEAHPILLPGVQSNDFENLISFFYLGPYAWTKEGIDFFTPKWESILRIAEMFDMQDICKVAVYGLCEYQFPGESMRKIALFVQYDLDEKFLLEQLVDVCLRSDSLTVEEGRKIGPTMATLIGRAREVLIRRAFALRRAPQATKEEAENVVKEIILAAYSS
ncbi:hypothetical protein K525DRAFT_283745 [Schizophyllum commune Loenen D]|nr:hypothetical protein K525DRAFT_283745 [Schizophyllum commune Loenen D]